MVRDYDYDARGRVRRISRQIAKPEGLNVGSRYAPHWFASRLDYDLGDRLARRTTGVDVADLLMNGASEDRYSYSPRGLLSSIDSSYGQIVKTMLYGPDGAPNRITYGDRFETMASFEYDARRRLTRYHLLTPNDRVTGFPMDRIDYRFSSYDEVGNPRVIEDVPMRPWPPLPPHAAPVKKREMEYDDLYRLIRIDNTYKTSNGIAPWRSPFEAEISAGDHRPVPLRDLPTRVARQTFDYDGLGNLTASSDDLSAHYDRSLGAGLGYGTAASGPNQLRSGDGLRARYDDAGNLVELKLERPGKCRDGKDSRCAQWFTYDWDEVGQLARARRWDFDGNAIPPHASSGATPPGKPNWDLTYAYSLGGRVRKTATDDARNFRHTLEIFDTLRVERAPFNKTDGNYQAGRDNVHVYPGGMAHVFWDTQGKLAHQAPGSLITMHLVMGDHLGSSSVVINHATSELVERTTYEPYGAVESDYRPERWNSFREDYKFTGKEEDIEVGATYFGARYYQPYLGRWMSADPLTVHGLGSDLNPYAYVGGQVLRAVDPMGTDAEPKPPVDCPPGATCLPEDTIKGSVPRDPAPPEPPAQSTPPAPSAQQPPALKEPTQPVKIRDPISFERGPVGDPESHVNITNLAKETWNVGVETVAMAATSSPLTWYSAYRMWTDLRFDVPDEPGDISKGIVFAGSMLVPGPEGKGAAAKQLAVNAAKGRNFQKLVRAAIGAVGIFQRSKVFKGGSIFRRTIPDALSDIALVEIKNVAELGYTPQLGAQIYAAAASNRTYVLVINMETKVYKPLVETIEAFNGFIVRFNPETRTFHPF